MKSSQVDTVVIGGGQAGLAIGYYLRQRGLPLVILDENSRVGDVWRNRWDSLRLFTPRWLSGLPGLPFPGPSSAYPTKGDVADYFEGYAREFELPVRTGIKVERLSAASSRFEVFCRNEKCRGNEVLSANQVVVASGAFHHPRVPDFASALAPAIIQIHSKRYRNPSQVQPGGVLVVGAGNSGAEIAIELARHHKVWLSGPDTGQEPTRAGSFPDRVFTPLMWLVATRLTVRSAAGRKLRDHFLDPPRGIPLGRVRRRDIIAAGIERIGKTTGVRDGYPVIEDGRVLEVSNVIWCTGFTPDFSWIDLAFPTTLRGWPIQDRGIVDAVPRLYFVGLPFLYSLSSVLLGGVGRDAKHIVDHIATRRCALKDPTRSR
jgi:putative flavoprotein involved in K+ transport